MRVSVESHRMTYLMKSLVSTCHKENSGPSTVYLDLEEIPFSYCDRTKISESYMGSNMGLPLLHPDRSTAAL